MKVNKCIMCKTGNPVKSGEHTFCDQCGFITFNLTEDYIDSCTIILATLVSNTRYATQDGYYAGIAGHIEKHLPMLHSWLNTITNGRAEMIANIAEQAMTHSVNLQVDETKGPEEIPDDLTCSCGSVEFLMEKVGLLICKTCEAVFKYSEESSRYEPHFHCDCGSLTYKQVDTSGLCECANCQKAYMYNSPTDSFQVIT